MKPFQTPFRATPPAALTLAVLVAAAPAASSAATAAKSAPSETAAVAQRLWAKLLTTCGASSFYVGSDLDGSDDDMFRDRDIRIIEFRGVRYQTVPIRVSEAEALNGVSAHARISMIAHTYRVEGEPWRDGPDLVPRSVSDQMDQSFRQVWQDDKELGKAGAMALDLARIHGRWVIRRSSLILSDNVSLKGNVDLEEFIAKPASHYVCATGKATPRPPRPPTEEEIAAAKAETEAKARQDAIDARHQAERAQFEAEMKAIHDVSHAAFVERRKVLDPAEKAWRFVGSPQAFHEALKANLARRGAEFGFDPANYQAEIAAIDDAVAVCMTVTAEQWRETEALWEASIGKPNLPWGISNMKAREERLHNCDNFGPVWGDPLSPAGKPHSLGIRRHMSKVSQGAGLAPISEPLPYFEVRIVVKPTKEDWARIGAPQIDELPYRFNVIDARIPFPGKAVTPDLAAWARGE